MNLDKYMEILLKVWDTDEQTVDDCRGTKIVLIPADLENEVGHHPLSYPEPMATLMIQHYSLLSAADQLKLRNCEGGLVIWDMESILAPAKGWFRCNSSIRRISASSCVDSPTAR